MASDEEIARQLQAQFDREAAQAREADAARAARDKELALALGGGASAAGADGQRTPSAPRQSPFFATPSAVSQTGRVGDAGVLVVPETPAPIPETPAGGDGARRGWREKPAEAPRAAAPVFDAAFDFDDIDLDAVEEEAISKSSGKTAPSGTAPASMPRATSAGGQRTLPWVAAPVPMNAGPLAAPVVDNSSTDAARAAGVRIVDREKDDCGELGPGYISADRTVRFGIVSDKAYGTKCRNWSSNTDLLGRIYRVPGVVLVEGTDEFHFPLDGHDAFVEQLQLGHYTVDTIPASVLARLRSSRRLREEDRKAVEGGMADMLLADYPEPLKSALLGYQREGLVFCARRGGRCMIADEMGVGKTVQSIAAAWHFRGAWPLLIIVPSSLRGNWNAELLRWLPEPSLRPADINVVMSGKGNLRGRVNIISYDLVSRMLPAIKAQDFQVIIADESHFIKSLKAQRTKAIMPLLKNAQHRILLTGTPALSRPAELFTQLQSICPKDWPNFNAFAKRYCAAKMTHFGLDTSGSSNLRELNLLISGPVLIRRLKKDVLSQLPPKRRSTVQISCPAGALRDLKKQSEQLSKLGSEMEAKGPNAGAARGARRAVLMDMFRKTGAAKIKAVQDYVKVLLESGTKFLIFAHHQNMLDAIEDALGKTPSIRIDGKTDQRIRQQLVNRFQSQDSIRAAILSITAAGVGLTLTASSCVVFAELYWTPGSLIQAEDRAHRIGQKDSINVYFLLAKGTLDDELWPMIAKKLAVVGTALNGASVSLNAARESKADRERRERLSAQKSLVSSRELADLSEIPDEEGDEGDEEDEEEDEHAGPAAKRARTTDVVAVDSDSDDVPVVVDPNADGLSQLETFAFTRR